MIRFNRISKTREVINVMTHLTLLLWFAGHLLGDFYFQTSTLAIEKEISAKPLFIHCGIYLLTMIAVSIPVLSFNIFICAVILGFIHLIVDTGKFFIRKHHVLTHFQTIALYLGDQAIHILTILTVTAAVELSNVSITYIRVLEPIVNGLELNMIEIVSWAAILLLLFQPCSITIRKVLDYFEPETEEYTDEGIKNAGALIGILERFIILLMIYANQFTAIGFVLTAKSIARYNKISENPQFAEYYLLGTLFSSLLIIVSYYIIF